MKTLYLINLIIIIFIFSLFLPSCSDDDSTDMPQTIACSDVLNDAVWEDRGEGVDYVIDCVIDVNAKLTIEPGVTIKFSNNAGIIINSGGSLSAIGSVDKPIILCGDVDQAGVWKGLYFKSNSVLNELNYCTITNGGSAGFDVSTQFKSNIRVRNSAQLKIRNSIISKSAKDGIYVDGLDTDSNNPITAFNNNTFIDNQNYPISAIASTANILDGTSSIYSGNSFNKVLLRGGRMYGNHTWKKMNVPYLVQSIASVGYYSDNGNLTIEPGVLVEFTDDSGLCTGDYSTGSWLKAIGTASERIRFTGETTLPGAWKGIAFQSTSPNNQLSYIDISYGGSSSYTGATDQRANLLGGAYSVGTFTIDNSTITDSQAWGIYVRLSSPAIIVPGSVIYTNNASGNYFQE
jgi:hypothetical protein